MEVAMRATAGEIVENAGAYRCLCCGQRVYLKDRDVFERCKSCDCSIFDPDWRCSEYPSDQACEITPPEAIDDSTVRQWSML